MRKLETSVIGIDEGEVVLFSDFESGGDMWTGEGPRDTRVAITFSESYLEKPHVSASVSMLDMSNSANIRTDLQRENITKTGFDIVFRTWGDTQVARCRVAWQSIGPVTADDVWDI